jgi:hypothetical protein
MERNSSPPPTPSRIGAVVLSMLFWDGMNRPGPNFGRSFEELKLIPNPAPAPPIGSRVESIESIVRKVRQRDS